MQLRIDTPILDENDNPMIDPNTGEAITVKQMAVVACFNSIPGDAQVGKDQKTRVAQLGKKIKKCMDPVVEVTPDELAILDNRCGYAFGPLVVDFLAEHFNNMRSLDEAEKKEKEEREKAAKEAAEAKGDGDAGKGKKGKG